MIYLNTSTRGLKDFNRSPRPLKIAPLCGAVRKKSPASQGFFCRAFGTGSGSLTQLMILIGRYPMFQIGTAARFARLLYPPFGGPRSVPSRGEFQRNAHKNFLKKISTLTLGNKIHIYKYEWCKIEFITYTSDLVVLEMS